VAGRPHSVALGLGIEIVTDNIDIVRFLSRRRRSC
jgi:hypothetical protein